jgi:hypothetical protein
MAGVLLRHVITGHWIRIDAELKVAIKRNLFGMLAQEGVYVVIHTATLTQQPPCSKDFGQSH